MTGPLTKASNLPPNELGIGVEGNQAEGVTAGGYVSKDLGQGRSLDAQAGINSRTGWGFWAFFKKRWTK
jgi:hypothetical protein